MSLVGLDGFQRGMSNLLAANLPYAELEAAGTELQTVIQDQVLGHYQTATGPFGSWPELADSTKADRVRQGYTENDPLLRSGQMRDDIQILRITPDSVYVGIADTADSAPYARTQELGDMNRGIPARSFLGIGMLRYSGQFVGRVELAVKRLLG